MSTHGLDVFDKTIHTTNGWLNEISAVIGPDRQLAWHALGAVLRAVRDRLPADLSAHLSSQLPLIVRGTYYDQYQPSQQPAEIDTLEAFCARITTDMQFGRPVNPVDALRAVLATLSRHIPPGQIEKVRHALPRELRAFWDECEAQLTGRTFEQAG